MPIPTTGRLADPDFRRWRASYAARARTRPDHHIDKLVEAAPLTDEQIERLRALLPPVANTDDNAATPSD